MRYCLILAQLRGVSGGVRQMERGAAPAARSERSGGDGAIRNRMGSQPYASGGARTIRPPAL